MSTLPDILASQTDLEAQAAEALPHSFSHCTYPLGELRQSVYLCLTCAEPRGICSACSIACHGDHEQLELFPKRDFQCDCPTHALAHPCTLHTIAEAPNVGNSYGQNFRGLFCRCSRKYEAEKERETMIQCLACEDWFHESCLNLRERPDSREPSPAQIEQPTEDEAATEDDDASSSGLPPPLIRDDEYDAFVCGSCVTRVPVLRRYAGTPGVRIVVRDSDTAIWRVEGAPESESEPVEVGDEADVATGSKRTRAEDGADESDAKRARVSPSLITDPKATPTSPCLAPPPNPLATDIMTRHANGDPSRGAGDIFLADGWRERWCRCSSCAPSFDFRSYLLSTPEETYTPPPDPDAGLSLEALGMRALMGLPRAQAIDSLRAFNEMRDGLMDYLRPFAAEGRVVGEEDVRAFFEEKERQRGGR
ncbi:hypothetical protein FIBSPDRAFT_786274 [Athelia psychrophila]|uniref:UBR-type domain-containing protein n=1 Tax=Athelia psychrophila TaxID=1759441 RepID=A0A166LW94_9AGAM|nr:hypothetical protein FIBSPDRAFT_786274 [Fibularhizoctonia sp. CBS 109695]